MRKPRLIAAAVLTLIAIAAVPAAANASDFTNPQQWLVENTNTVSANTNYELHNLIRRENFLTSQFGYPKQESGHTILYGWTGHSGGYFVFRRPNERDHRHIQGDFETVAIYNTKIKKYLHMSRTRAYWNGSAAYEWQLHDISGPKFSLYNTSVRDYFGVAPDLDYLGWVSYF
jgi:hypothetical protein